MLLWLKTPFRSAILAPSKGVPKGGIGSENSQNIPVVPTRQVKVFLCLLNVLTYIDYTQFFYKQLLNKQQGFKNLQIKQSEGFKKVKQHNT